MSRTILTAGRVAIGLGLLAYLMASGGLQWSALLGLVRLWPVTILSLTLLSVALVLTSWRLCLLIRPMGFQLSLMSSVRLTLIGTFFNTCLPGGGGGDIVRIYYGTVGNEGRKPEVVTVMLLDRITGLLALVMWPLLVAPVFWSLLQQNAVLRAVLGAGVVAVIGIVALFIASWAPILAPESSLRRRVGTLPGGRIFDQIVGTIAAFRHHRIAVVTAVAVSLLSHTIAMGVVLLLAHVTNPAGFAWEMSLLIPLGFMANAVPLTPGGLGVGEAAFETLFGIVGLTGGAETLLAWRLVLLVIGLVGLLVYLQGRRQFVASAISTVEPVEATRPSPSGKTVGEVIDVP